MAAVRSLGALGIFLAAVTVSWGQAAPAAVPASYPLLPLVALSAAGSSITMSDGSYGPALTISLPSDFQISRYPVTNSEFALFVADGGYGTRSYWTANGWAWKGARTQPAFTPPRAFAGEMQPAVGVTWYEAVAFCNWLSAKEGLAPAYGDTGRAVLGASGYRLPTEVEYEYAAARGGPDDAERIYPWGNDAHPQYAVSSVPPGNASATEDVTSRSPTGDTPQGVADMSGNVWEWCSDNFQGDAEITASVDRYYFVSDARAERFSLHGGSWVISFAGGLHTRFRSFSSEPGALLDSVGFRVVRRQPGS
jgi:formylglycine-generating enzyme required for sulfatase activity